MVRGGGGRVGEFVVVCRLAGLGVTRGEGGARRDGRLVSLWTFGRAPRPRPAVVCCVSLFVRPLCVNIPFCRTSCCVGVGVVASGLWEAVGKPGGRE